MEQKPEHLLPVVEKGKALRRSLINEAVMRARDVLRALHVHLPGYATWTPSEWEATGVETQEIRDCMLGWDVTDFGSGQFEALGRTLFTLRNGRAGDLCYGKPYAEKLLIEIAGQRSPMHYHRSKQEDIINRAGGNVLITLYPVGQDGLPGEGRIEASIDGLRKSFHAGEAIRLKPGESLSIVPHTYHQFWAEEGTGLLMDGTRYTVSSEVSSVCDDWNDNVFIESWAERFPRIVEDEARACYLCHEYPSLTETRLNQGFR